MSFDPLWLIFLGIGLGLMPIVLMMATSYVKIVVVISLVRNALGVQQIPPQIVINGLAMILTLFIMAPVANDMGKLIEQESEHFSEIQPTQILEVARRVSPPLKKFLLANTDERVSNMLINTSDRIWPKELKGTAKKEDWCVMLPAFTITELTKAFQIGFVLYLAFIALDLIISNILLAMGMMMVSPMTISLPFKLLLFVTLDGWLKITQGLILSYH